MKLPTKILAYPALLVAVLPISVTAKPRVTQSAEPLRTVASPLIASEELLVPSVEALKLPGELATVVRHLLPLLARSDSLSKSERTKGNSAIQKIGAESSWGRGLLDEFEFVRGLAFEVGGDQTKALSAYDASLKHRSDNPTVVYRRAITLKRQGKCVDAIKAFAETRWISTVSEESVLLHEAECFETLGLPLEAQAALDKAQKKNPSFPPVLRKLTLARAGVVESKGSLPSKTVASLANDLQSLIDLNPQDRALKLILAKLLVRKSDPLVGKDQFRRGLELTQQLAEEENYIYDDCVRLLFDAHVRSGNLDEASRILTRGLSVTPGSQLLRDAARQLEIQRGTPKI